MNTELFYPAPPGFPVPIRPARGSNALLEKLGSLDWDGMSTTRNRELLRAGALWLYGFLDESHAIAQGIDSSEGSYWHALMHRSEGDFGNSKYWYRRVGRHAIFPDLLAAARQLEVGPHSTMGSLLKSTDWDPFRFVDVMERAASHETKVGEVLQAIVREEYNLLMSYCLAKR